MKKLPKFRSRQSEREFWDTHDVLDYFDPKEFVPLAPLMEGVKLAHIYVAPDGNRYEIRPLSPESRRTAAKPPVSGHRKQKTSQTSFLAR